MNPLFVFLTLLSYFTGSYSFKASRSFLLNGKTYTETIEQPWFRNRHKQHTPIPDSLVNETSFGKHELPDNDIYIPNGWTDHEKQYLPCTNLQCVCPFFNGSLHNEKCVLKNGKSLKKAVRREIRTLSDDERQLVEMAFNKMKEKGTYDRIGLIHKYKGVHEGPGFFTWHREFLKRAELLLRQNLPEGSTIGIPYWDSSLDAHLPNPAHSIFFSDKFVGSTGEDNYVKDGPYAHWKTMEGTRRVIRYLGQKDDGEVLNDARIDLVLNQTKVEQVLAAVMPLESCPLIIRDDRLLEYSHDYVHDFVNGDMKESYSSSSEITFYFHHTMVDNIWEMWRNKAQTRSQRETDYPPPLPECYPPKHFAHAHMVGLEPYTNFDVLSNTYTDNMYSYATRPKCTSKNEECGSKYLFCYTAVSPPRCMSKVKLGGECAGYENSDICYDGYCRHQKCVQKKNYFYGM